jgi:uncharacterized protein
MEIADAPALADTPPHRVAAGAHRLDPRSVTLGRLARWPVAALPLLLTLPGLLVNVVGPRALSPLAVAAVVALAVSVTAALALVAQIGPLWRYRYTRYRVDDHGIEIARGHAWRRLITVPRSRVQHTDVTQGPLERRFGLATLIIYTAGTDHSAVPLTGLAHEAALALRDDLLHAGRGDAI